MRLGQWVYFKSDGILKKGYVRKEIGTDDLLIICEDIPYQRHHWEVRKVPDEKN